MKVLVSLVLGIIACLGVAGGAVLTGIVHIPSSAIESNFLAIPPLQPDTAQTPVASDMTITLSERFMGSQIALSMPPGGEVSNPQIDLHANGLADFTGLVKTGFLTFTPKASVRFSVVKGRIVIDILQINVGGFGIPTSLIEPQIAQLKQTGEIALNQQFAAMQTNAGLTLQSLTTTENSVTLNFTQ